MNSERTDRIRVRLWNKHWPIGSRVVVIDGDYQPVETTTTGEANIEHHDTGNNEFTRAVLPVEGFGEVGLERCLPLPTGVSDEQ